MDSSLLNNLMMAAAITMAIYLVRRRLSSPTVEVGVLAEALARGAMVVDVRSAGEFASGHVAEARNIPVDQLARRTRDLGSKKRPVIVYCASGMRSRSARSSLEREGFASVIDLGSMRNAERALQAAREAPAALEANHD